MHLRIIKCTYYYNVDKVKVVDGLDDKQMPGWNGTKPPAYYPGEDSSDVSSMHIHIDNTHIIL